LSPANFPVLPAQGDLMPFPFRAVPVTLAALLAGATPLAAQQPDSAAVPAPSLLTPASLEAGRKVFHGKGNCWVCHGSALQGGAIAPPLVAHKWRDGDGSYQMILQVLTHGVKNTAMVARPGGLSDADLRLVAAYVWAVSHGQSKP
jgi:mono/diheme cytochrome c family protein